MNQSEVAVFLNRSRPTCSLRNSSVASLLGGVLYPLHPQPQGFGQSRFAAAARADDARQPGGKLQNHVFEKAPLNIELIQIPVLFHSAPSLSAFLAVSAAGAFSRQMYRQVSSTAGRASFSSPRSMTVNSRSLRIHLEPKLRLSKCDTVGRLQRPEDMPFFSTGFYYKIWGVAQTLLPHMG